jgi:hypothetical protein
MNRSALTPLAPPQQQHFDAVASSPQHYEPEQIGVGFESATVGRSSRGETIFKNMGLMELLTLLLVIACLILLILLLVWAHHHHSGSKSEPGNCIKIKHCGYTMSKDGRCYKLVKDLVWGGDATPCLTATGNDMVLYGRRYNITLTGQTSQALLVVGTSGVFGPDASHGGSLRVFDLNIRGSTFLYSNLAYGATVETGGSLDMTRTGVHSVSFAFQNFNGLLSLDTYTVTGTPVEDSADRADQFALGQLGASNVQNCGVFAFGSGKTVLLNGNIVWNKINPDCCTAAGPIVNAGIFQAHDPVPGGLLSNPGDLFIDGINILADAGILALRVLSINLNNADIEVYEDLAVPDQSGIIVGCGNTSNNRINNVFIDCSKSGFAGSGMMIEGTNGILITNLDIVGRTMAGWSYLDSNLGPHIVYRGLLNFDVFDDTFYNSGAIVNGFTLRATTRDTYGITVGSDGLSFGAITGFDPCNPNVNAVLRNGRVEGGSVGLLVGAAAADVTVDATVVLSNNSFGAFVMPAAENVPLQILSMSQARIWWQCIGLFTSFGAGDVISQHDHFSHNNFDIIDLAGTVIQSEDVSTGESAEECDAPLIFDSCIPELAANNLENENINELVAPYGVHAPQMNFSGSFIAGAVERMRALLALRGMVSSAKKKRAILERKPVAAAATQLRAAAVGGRKMMHITPKAADAVKAAKAAKVKLTVEQIAEAIPHIVQQRVPASA